MGVTGMGSAIKRESFHCRRLTSSVETLKGRASEMQRMRDVEKARRRRKLAA